MSANSRPTSGLRGRGGKNKTVVKTVDHTRRRIRVAIFFIALAIATLIAITVTAIWF